MAKRTKAKKTEAASESLTQTDGKPESIQRMRPEKLLKGYSRLSVLGIAVLVSLFLHVALVAATSVNDIRGWLDPEWKAEQAILEKEAAEASEIDLKAAKQKDVIKAAKAKQEAAAAKENEDDAGEGDGEAKEGDEDWKDTAVGKRITETANPDDIPDDPFDLPLGDGDDSSGGEE